MPIVKAPIFVDLDRRRLVCFNLGAEARVQAKIGEDSKLWEDVGDAGDGQRRLRLNLDTLIVYLWASIYDDARAHGDLLDVADVAQMVNHRRKKEKAFAAVSEALVAYYGDDEGEDDARA